jgi:hypothetical protein
MGSVVKNKTAFFLEDVGSFLIPCISRTPILEGKFLSKKVQLIQAQMRYVFYNYVDGYSSPFYFIIAQNYSQIEACWMCLYDPGPFTWDKLGTFRSVFVTV